jgi:hypothetical protein
MKRTDPKFVVVANLKEDVPGLLAQADGFVAGVEGHKALFPNADPVLQGVKDARKALGDAHTTSAPLKRAALTRSPVEITLHSRLTDAARFVETCANNDPANGPAIIAASTFSQKRRSPRTKAAVNLKNGKPAGSVLADAKAAKKGTRAFYCWRWSLDGNTWVELAQTNDHKTTITGLQIGKTVYVQVAITQKNVRSPWSDSASILVA